MRLALLVILLIGFAASGEGETFTLTRFFLRPDGTPVSGAKVRVLSDDAFVQTKTDFEAVADAYGQFVGEVTSEKAWYGRLIVSAPDCATTCEMAINLYGRDPAQRSGVLKLRAARPIGGKITSAEGMPIAHAQIFLVSAHPKNWNPVPFNSTTSHPRTTAAVIAESSADGTWEMNGIDLVMHDRIVPARLTFEAIAQSPLRAARVDLQVDPESAPAPSIHIDFKLAPLVHIAGSVVNSVTGVPVPGAQVWRNVGDTMLADSAPISDKAGRFDLAIPKPVRSLWFHLYCDGFATAVVKSVTRDEALEKWPEKSELVVRMRPLVEVAGKVEDESGQALIEPLTLAARYEEKIDDLWTQESYPAVDCGEIDSDGTFHARLATGCITLRLCRPPESMGSLRMHGEPARYYKLREEIEIPPEGLGWLKLKPTFTLDL